MRFISGLWRHIYVAECKWIVHIQLDSYPIDLKCKWALTVCFVVVSGEQRAVEGEEEDCGPSWDRDAEDSLGIFLNIIQKSIVLLVRSMKVPMKSKLIICIIYCFIVRGWGQYFIPSCNVSLT